MIRGKYQKAVTAHELKKLPVGTKATYTGPRTALTGETIMSGKFKIFAYYRDGVREFKPITDVPGYIWSIEEEVE